MNIGDRTILGIEAFGYFGHGWREGGWVVGRGVHPWTVGRDVAEDIEHTGHVGEPHTSEKAPPDEIMGDKLGAESIGDSSAP